MMHEHLSLQYIEDDVAVLRMVITITFLFDIPLTVHRFIVVCTPTGLDFVSALHDC